MTYLELTNRILRRLRERPVETVNQTAYSNLIGLFINDAKTTVEEAWKWSALRTTLTANTTAGVFSYELNGSKNNFSILDVINASDNFFMQYRDAHSFNALFNNSTPSTGSPYYYSFNGVSSDGDTQVDVFPIPNDDYTLRFNVVQRSAELEEDAAVIDIPIRPIELLAYALAVEERGEDGGNTPIRAYELARLALADAITLDADKHPEELIWYSV